MNKERLKKKWKEAINLITDTQDDLLEIWRIKEGDMLASNMYPDNEIFEVDNRYIIFMSDGFPEFRAEGGIIKMNGKPGKRRAKFSEPVVDGIWYDDEH